MKFRGARLVRREPEARTRSERATELAQASVGEEQRAAGLDVRTLWEVGPGGGADESPGGSSARGSCAAAGGNSSGGEGRVFARAGFTSTAARKRIERCRYWDDAFPAST